MKNRCIPPDFTARSWWSKVMPLFCKNLCDLLANEGYTIIAVPDGQAALTYFQHGPPCPCVILLDLLMLMMNEYDFRQVLGLMQQDYTYCRLVRQHGMVSHCRTRRFPHQL
jgi:CheY-like chemotaxis protein